MMLHAGAMLSGAVFVDSDGDGVRSASEVGVPGVVVRLSGPSASDAERSTITDDNGAYTFDELEPGTYQVTKRQTAATNGGQDSDSDSDSDSGSVAATSLTRDVELADDEESTGNDFAERGLRPGFFSVAWYMASSPPASQLLRHAIARSEELAGEADLAETIRGHGNDVPHDSDDNPDDSNGEPTASDDAFSVDENGVLTIDAAAGVLANDSDPDGDPITAFIVGQPDNGAVSLNDDGSFTYTPDTDFSGPDAFTYQVSDSQSTSNLATVRIDVDPSGDVGNLPFGAITTGPPDDPNLLGTRTDTQPGAPPFSRDHVTTAVDYSGFGDVPPSYGAHHAFLLDAQNNPITPRPTGVYLTEQPDEDLVHNLEHGHVWISYNPSLISSSDLEALEQLVEDGGTDAGVILTPRAKNGPTIVLTSWIHQQTLDSFDATTVRDFIVTNRGHSPEGFIPSGQRTASSESLSDSLPHST